MVCREGMTVATAEVEVIGLALAPAVIEIAPRTSVRWTNLDRVTHTITEGAPESATHLWDSGTLPPGESFERAFCDVGAWTYFSATHPLFMQGAIVRVR